MQAYFKLPWSDQVAPKMDPGNAGKGALETMRTSPVVDTCLPLLNKLKRKRTGSEEVSPARDQLKKPRSDGEALQEASHGVMRSTVKSDPQQLRTAAQTSCAAPQRHPAVQSTTTNSSESLMRADSPTQPEVDMNIKLESIKQPSPVATSLEDVPVAEKLAPATEDALGFSPLQQVIENEFNMQILMKHNELRLIEQELAKCQVALEQLRRCEVKPFPGDHRPSESVSAGTGPAIAPAAGYTRPSHAAPYDVTEGPYARHYRHWLLPDAQFDSVPEQLFIPADSGPFTGVRSTRGHGTARKSLQKPVAAHNRGSDSMHSIPNYPPPAPKDKSSPLVLRRSTDNQLVKLICNNCLRGNFSSIQGFLNHCRIAHKVDYKSHDAAAVDCGRTLEEHEVANLPPETHALPAPAAPKPSASRSSSTVTTPFKPQGHVHPLNFATGAGMPVATSQTQHSRAASDSKPVPVPPMSHAAAPSNRGELTTSSQAPRLSAQYAKYQLGGNLEQAITNAKQKVDLGAEDDVQSPDVSESASPMTPAGGSRTISGTSRAGSLAPPGIAPRPPSRKGHSDAAQRHRPSPLAPIAARGLSVPSKGHGEAPESPNDQSPDLSPHTADSNPGLVSDHEDDDHGSASEDEMEHAPLPPHSLGVRRGGCNDRVDSMDLDVSVDDDIDGQHGVVIRRNSMTADNSRLRTAEGSSAK